MLGYFKGEPVYSRISAKSLRSAEGWLKLARVVEKARFPYATNRRLERATEERPLMTVWRKIHRSYLVRAPLVMCFIIWQ